MRSKVSRRTFGAGMLTTGLLGKAAPALAQGEPRPPSNGRGGTLVATWGGGEPQACYVPAGGGSSPTFTSSKLFERLGSRHMDGVFVGELAEAWKPAADFKSYTVKIRKGVKFHDGKDMTVDDVVYSISEIWKKYGAAAAMTDFASISFAKPGRTPPAGTVVALVGEDLVHGPGARALGIETIVRRAAAVGDFKGKSKAILDLLAPAGTEFDRLILVGTGKADEIADRDWINLGGAAMGAPGISIVAYSASTQRTRSSK